MPLGIRQNGFLLFYPLVGEFLAAGWAEPAFTTETDFLLMATFCVAALEHRMTPNGHPAAEHLDDVISDGGAHTLFVFFVEPPP